MIARAGESAGDSATSRKTATLAFGLVTALFFFFGFITCLNDILVPHLKALFTLTYAKAALIQFCFFAAYFMASLPSGKLVESIGYKRGTIIGAVVTAVGCLLFYPAAAIQSYGVFLFGLFVLACGITLIQVAVNPYVAILGPSETASARLNLAQAFNSLGTTIAPIFGSVLILSVAVKTPAELSALSASAQAAYRSAQASSVQGPYLELAFALAALAAIVALCRIPSGLPETSAGSDETTRSETTADLGSAWRYRHLVLGAVGIFCYVGAEVAIGSYLVNFMGLQEVASLPEALAAKYVALYWGGAMIGRFIGSAVLRKFQPNRALASNAFVAAALVLLGMVLSGRVAMWAVLAIGLFNSIMFPTIFTLAIKGLGKNTAQASGILCMAIVGGAAIPLFQGALADAVGLHHSYVLPVFCYLYIAFYGLRGYRPQVAPA